MSSFVRWLVRFCYACALCALGHCVCQDVSSFGNSLSRYVIFRQVARPFVRFCALCALGPLATPVKMSSGGFVRFYYACALCCSVCIGCIGSLCCFVIVARPFSYALVLCIALGPCVFGNSLCHLSSSGSSICTLLLRLHK